MYNKVIIIGRVGKKPELKEGKRGNKYSSFSVAVNSFSGGKEETQWFDITTFNKIAESCSSNLDKGSVVAIEGKLQNNEYEKDGVKRKTTVIIADKVLFLSPKTNGNNSEIAPSSQNLQVPIIEEQTDDIPF